MPKKKKSSKSSMGAQGPGQIGGAGRMSRDPGSFTGTGTRPRVIKAQEKVRSLVGQGYRLNPKANTSSTYKKAVKSAGSAAGKLRNLFR